MSDNDLHREAVEAHREAVEAHGRRLDASRARDDATIIAHAGPVVGRVLARIRSERLRILLLVVVSGWGYFLSPLAPVLQGAVREWRGIEPTLAEEADRTRPARAAKSAVDDSMPTEAEVVGLGRINAAFGGIYARIEDDRGGSAASGDREELGRRLVALRARASRAVALWETLTREIDAYEQEVVGPDARGGIPADIADKIAGLRGGAEEADAIIRRYYADHALRLALMLEHPDGYDMPVDGPKPRFLAQPRQKEWDRLSVEIDGLRRRAHGLHVSMRAHVMGMMDRGFALRLGEPVAPPAD